MKDYRVEKVLFLTGGIVRLSDDQSRRRALNIKKTNKKGLYDIMQPVQFKVGEIIGLGKPSKANAQSLVDIEAEEKELAEKEKLAAKAEEEADKAEK
jgi:hypothetical protein